MVGRPRQGWVPRVLSLARSASASCVVTELLEQLPDVLGFVIVHDHASWRGHYVADL